MTKLEFREIPTAEAAPPSAQAMATLWLTSITVVAAALGAVLAWTRGPLPGPSTATGFLESVDTNPTSLTAAIQDRRDTLAWFAVVAVTISAVLLAGKFVKWLAPRLTGRGVMSLAVVSIALLATQAALAATRDARLEGIGYWDGWTGYDVIFSLVALAILLYAPRIWTSSISLLIPGIFIWGLLGVVLWVTPSSVRDVYHTSFVLDELLAPAAGKHVLVDYYPMYTQLLGYPLNLARLVVGHGVEAAGLAWLMLLQVCCLALIGLAASRSLNSRYLPLLLFVTPIALMMSGSSRWIQTGYFQVFPLRYVFACLLLLLMTLRFSIKNLVLVGLFAVMAVINNPEWGLPAAGAAGAVVLLTPAEVAPFNRLLSFASGAIGGLVAVWVLMSTVGQTFVNIEDIFIFPQIFGQSGFFAVPALPQGPQWVVVGTFISGAVLGAVGLSMSDAESPKVRLPRIMLYWNLFALGASFYWFNRSLQPVLYALLLAWAVSLVLTAAAALRIVEPGGCRGREKLILAWLIFPLALAFSGVMHLPSFDTEVARIRSTTLSYPPSIGLRESVAAASAAASGERLGLVVENGSMEILRLENNAVYDAGLFNGPGNVVKMRQVEMICNSLSMKGTRYVLIQQIPGSWLDSGLPCAGWTRLNDSRVTSPYSLFTRRE